MIIGDSRVRGFARIRRELRGMSISAFGGMEVLELICILQAGRLLNGWDLTKTHVRNRFQANRDEFPTIRFCTHCYSECANEFKGDLILVIGLNNILKAERLPFATVGGQNMQDFDGMFKMLDDACKKVVPNAKVKLAPVLKVKRLAGERSILTELAINKIEENISARDTLEMNAMEPLEKDLYDDDGVHMKNKEGADFWMKIFVDKVESNDL